MSQNSPFYGKYRGVVTDNQDPLMAGRIRVRTPAVMGEAESAWASPAAPFGFLALPGVGANVWVEFEQGDPDLPIWSGTWWGSPTELPASRVMVRTSGGHTVTLDDTPGAGGIVLETPAGQMIALNEAGIVITNGKGASITLTGPAVSVNGGALEVT
jgi:uncharacterized protein involved in type VI secretion and phage assembly